MESLTTTKTKEMEILVSIFLPLVIFVCTFVAIFKIWSKPIQPTTRSPSHCPLPPGYTGWPVIGETLAFASHMWKGTPEKFFHDRVRKYKSSTFKTSMFGDPTMVLYGAAGNKFLFMNEEKLVRQWWPLTVRKLLSIDTIKVDDVWIKGYTQSFLQPDSLQKYVGIMDSVAQSHFETKWRGTNSVMVCPLAKDYTLTLACRLLVSLEDSDSIEGLAESMDRIREGLFCLPINLPWTQFGRSMQACEAINKRLATIIKKKRQELAATGKDFNYNDVLSGLLLEGEESEANDKKMAGRIFGLLVAGHETVSATITMLFKYLGQNPEIYQRVFQEQMEISESKMKGELLNRHDISKMKYSWNVIQEVLRIHAPAIAVYREAISDFTYSGYYIPKGSKVHLNIHATHLDEKYFPNPKRFDPSRFENIGPSPYTYVPFGAGPKTCPGMSYAQMAMLVFLHNAVKRFKWDTIFHDEEIVLDPTPRPAKGLPVQLQPHRTHVIRPLD